MTKTGEHKDLLKQSLAALERMQTRLNELESVARAPIAIIGAGCRFPGGATDLDSFWQVLANGKFAVQRIPAERWALAGESNPEDPIYAGLIEDIEKFDARFFSISAREATTLDPQQRLVLEVAWEALENAGQAPSKLIGSETGVFIGLTNTDYAQVVRRQNEEPDIYSATGTTHNSAPGRVSYVLGLQGPSVAVDTACSSSLTSVHLACQSLRAGECSMALAGGVNILLDLESFRCAQSWGMLSPDGKCKTFDKGANGFVRAEGCGMVILKRLPDAIRDRDNILAVIRASVMNQDGKSSGLTVPNGLAQEAMLRLALERGKLAPEDVQYIEAHGTGTSIGDPIEFQALSTVLGRGRATDRPLIVGSLKTNIGHMEAAAGIGGLLKTVLAIQKVKIPPHLHLHEWNPQIQRDGAGITVPTTMTDWPDPARRIAGVSGFGFSGMNAHIVLEQPPELPARQTDVERPLHLFTLSAASSTALKTLAARHESYLREHPDASIGDVCFTANAGRSQFAHRVGVIAASTNQLAQKLGEWRQQAAPTTAVRQAPRIAFLFTGQGSYYAGMARQLYATQPVFRDSIRRCASVLDWLLDVPLETLLFAPDVELLGKTGYAQPALFALEFALAEMWMSWGIRPAYVMGHSLGEYTAACVAGAFQLEEGLRIIAERGRMMQALPEGGRMAVVHANEEVVRKTVDPRVHAVSIAALNGPEGTVISGAGAEVEQTIAELERMGVSCQAMRVSHAFHSPLMNPVLEPLERLMAGVSHIALQIPLVCNLTGEVVSDEASWPQYWRRHARHAVQFRKGIDSLYAQGVRAFVEVGPGGTLTALGRQCLGERQATLVPSLSSKKEDWQQVLETLTTLYSSGVEVDWEAFDRPYDRRTAPLPAYAFERQRYWVNARPETERRSGVVAGTLSGRHLTSPAMAGKKVVQFDLHSEMPFLRGHRIQGEILLPFAGYLELIRAAGFDCIEGFSVEQPLKMAESESRAVQLVSDGESLDVFSLVGDTWMRNASARVSRVEGEQIRPRLDEIRARVTTPASVEGIYASLRACSVEYGEEYLLLDQAFSSEGDEAIGRLNVKAFGAETLDACFQVIGAIPHDDDLLYLPVRVGSYRIHRPDTGVLFAHVKLSRRNEADLTADMTLFNEAGEVLAQLLDFRAQRVKVRRKKGHEALYEIAWKESERIEANLQSGPYLVITGDQDFRPSERFAHGVELTSMRAADNWQQALREQTWQGVVYAPGRKTTGEVALASVMRDVCGTALEIVKGIIASSTAPRLWMVTQGAHGVEGNRVEPTQTALWGFGRTVALEYPDTHCSMIDLGDGSEDDGWAEICAASDETAVAYRSGKRFVARLKPATSGRRSVKLQQPTPGVLENLELVPVERRAPGPREVEIRVLATGLNFRDVLGALGMYPGEMLGFGAECAGIIEQVGDQVQDWKPGDEVFSFAPISFASYATVPTEFIARKPGNISFAQAATLPVAFLTDIYGLEWLAGMKPGERVLIHAAAGGVGLAALQLVQAAGGEVFATAGSDEKREYLRRLGVKHIYNSRTLDFAEEINRAGGVDIVLNSLSGEFIPASISTLHPGGRFLELGKRGIWTDEQVREIRPDVRYYAFDLGYEVHADLSIARRLLDDLSGRLEKGILKPLPIAVSTFDNAFDAFRTMSRARHIGKLSVVHTNRGLAVSAAVQPDATYVITGGMGALGLETAKWLADRGAKRLVLIGRRAPSPAAAAAIEALRQREVNVSVSNIDIANLQEVTGLFERIATSMAPVRGIFHAAGVIDDGMAAQQTWERSWNVMAPKIAGGWNLHRISRNLPLDFFVLYSSVASVAGSPGQTSYASGNAYLDALAHMRRAEGLPALSVNWGAWANGGMAAGVGAQQQARWQKAGITPLEAAGGFELLEHAMDSGAPQVAAVSIDWNAYLHQTQGRPDSKFFSELSVTQARKSSESDNFLERLKSSPEKQQHAMLTKFLAEQARHVLGLDSSQLIDDSQPLQELGLDSVMAVELRTRITRGLHVDVPVTSILEGASLDQLSALALEKLSHNGVVAATAVSADVDRLVEAMQDAEVESMLKQMLAAGGSAA